VWVSTDDREISETAKKFGAIVLERPNYLAEDYSSAVDVVEHFQDTLSESLSESDTMLVYLQPTSPMRKALHLDAALLEMEHANVSSLVSVVKCKSSPYKAFKLNEDDMLQPLFGERSSNLNRQDLPQCYYPNGAIYAFMLKDFKKRGGFPSDGAFPFVMTDRDSVDIDSEGDLNTVEKIMEKLNGKF
jgi:CMP-N,N'-diacetyllegionaminic acid synthase